MEKTREDLLHGNHFIHIDMNRGSLLDEVNAYDQGVVLGLSE